MLQKVIDWLWDHSQPYFDLEGYMERRWLLVIPGLFSIRMHKILRSDDDRALHDHPFNYASLILSGGYFELTPDPFGGPHEVRRWCPPGSFRYARAESLHRLEIEPGQVAVTLFFIGRRKRAWGFQTAEGWTPHRAYAKDELLKRQSRRLAQANE